MKKFLLGLAALFCLTASWAQQNGRFISKAGFAKDFIKPQAIAAGVSVTDWDMMKVSSETFSKQSGVTNVYFQQTLNGIPVYNAILNVHITRDNKLLTYGNRFVKVDDAVRSVSSNPLLSPEQALNTAMASLGIAPAGSLQRKTAGTSPAFVTVFDKAKLALEDIKVQLVYQPMAEKNEIQKNEKVKQPEQSRSLRLAWQVEIYPADGKNYWSARIDAATGELLDKNNYVVTCHFGHANNQSCSHSVNEPHQDGLTSTYSFLNFKSTNNLVGSNDYKVYAQPVESPNHTTPLPPADGRTLVSNPANVTASPFGWHDTNGAAGAEFTTTQGNNVHAYTDVDANNLPDAGSSPDGGVNLVFNFPIDLTQPPSAYRPAAVTNLFYWNNFIHDFAYGYGFDEVSGNFQVNNYGNGGSGNDYVQAEAQDGSGTNNANFGTPPDGQRPRMQMYIGTTPTPDIDGDFDNAVIAHEYAHGISNRLTGGPATTSCLSNQEQMGEGWSDFYGYMTTMKPTDLGTTSRGIGTYLFGQPANGPGIRPTPYTTNMALNPSTYNTIKTAAVPHGVGYVWATMLWDLNWKLIEVYGFTNGFNKTMQLVNDGMKLQPCSPGFVDGRNAILAADQALYGGANQCLIWEVFARRGLGFSATQGSTNNVQDGVQAFDLPLSCLLDVTPKTLSVCQPSNAVYNINNSTNITYTMTTSGQPAGTTVSFSVNPVPGPGAATMTIGNTAAAVAGTYVITVTGTNGANVTNQNVTLIIQSSAPAAPVLTSPADAAIGQINPLLTWAAVSNAETYDLQVATDAGFTNIVASATGLTNTNYQTNALTNLTLHYWRVRAVNSCGNGNYAAAFSFTTANIICSLIPSTNVPIPIPDESSITSTIIISNSGTIADVNVRNLGVTHTFIDDLIITLKSPAGTIVTLMNRPCNAEDNILINFDDQAATATFPCPPTNNGTYIPFAALSAFIGQEVSGTWTLTVSDNVGADIGTLNSWSLDICYAPTSCTPPVITCPADVSVNNTTGQCGAIVTYPAATATGTTPVITYSHASGSFFPVGPTTVTATATNDCGTSSCSFTITVNDTQLPVISCPSNISVSATSAAGAVVTYTAPVGTDNCPGAITTLTAGSASGSTFPIGTTTVTYTVTDATGNTALCSFTVTVLCVAPQVVCPANITVNNTPGQCGANVTYPAATATGIPAPSITYSHASGSFFPVGTTTVTATATSDCGTSSCSFTITVNDTQLPVISCPSNISVNATSAAGAVVTYTAPVGTDNCPGAITALTAGPVSGSTFPIGTTTVTYTVTDATGNTAQCSFTVTVVCVAPQVVCPANIIVNNTPGQCGANVTYPAATATGTPAPTITYSKASGSFFPVGTTTVTATATNPCGTVTCTFNVTVVDNQFPVITCPFNITVNNDPGICGAVVNYNQPSATDNCGTGGIPTSIPGYTYKGTFGSHSYFVSNSTAVPEVAHAAAIALGGHLVTIASAAENAFVSAMRPETMWIGYTDRAVEGTYKWITNEPVTYTNWAAGEPNDYPNPGIPHEEDWAVINWTGGGTWNDWFYNISTYYVVEFEGGTIPTTLVSGGASGSVFPVGTNTVTYQATDASGNSSTCSFTVTVVDNTNPTISCPGPIAVNTDLGVCGAAVSYTVTSADNCPGQVVTQTGGISSGSVFPVGVTTNSFLVTDASGNTATCSFTVTVTDNQAPVITNCAANKTSATNAGLCTKTFTAAEIGLTTASDNCSAIVSWSRSDAAPNLADPFPFGITTITWTATDPAGLTATCTQTININLITTNTTVTVTPNPQQYSDKVTFVATVTPNNCANAGPIGGTVTFKIGTLVMGTAPVLADGTATLANIALLEPTLNGSNPTNGPLKPGTKTVTAVYSGTDPDYIVSDATTSLTITCEDARAYYTGACYTSTSSPNSSNATVTLSATIKDISATPDAAGDVSSGDIRNATVTFINITNNSPYTYTVIATVPVGLVNPGDLTVGTATYNWNVTINGDAQQYTIGIIVNNYYCRSSSDDNTVVNVAKPLGDLFITGGGYLVLTNSAGIKAGTAGTKNNFGFNVKYNRARTNLQGNINTIVRRMEAGVMRVYQIKGNAMTSLVVNENCPKTATFNGKANIKDITNPLVPVDVDGNATLQVKMTDMGEPGSSDKIAITVWNKTGGLWFASNWDGTRTVEQTLAGGNLKVHGGASCGQTFTRSEEVITEPVSFKVIAYPNPSATDFGIQVYSKSSEPIVVRILDMNGVVKEVRQVLTKTSFIKLGAGLPGGTYFAEVTQGVNKQVVKLIKLN